MLYKEKDFLSVNILKLFWYEFFESYTNYAAAYLDRILVQLIVFTFSRKRFRINFYKKDVQPPFLFYDCNINKIADRV